VVLAVVFALGGCVNTSGAPGQARIVNDTDKTVQVWQCSRDSCKSDRIAIGPWAEQFPSKDVLHPGYETDSFNISEHGVPNPYLLVTADGQTRLGCLPFVMPHLVEGGLTARVSQMIRCQSSYDNDVQWPPDDQAS
jgi:hypothetical protein